MTAAVLVKIRLAHKIFCHTKKRMLRFILTYIFIIVKKKKELEQSALGMSLYLTGMAA